MTTLMLLSDLHFEFHADKGRSFIDSLDPSNVDVLVLAGDIAGASSIERALILFSERFPKAIILFVSGNHEYYKSNRKDVHQSINAAVFGRFSAANHESANNVHWLNNDIYIYDGNPVPGVIFERKNQRVLGTTLWFPPARKSLEETWSDFNYIENFKNWVYEENRKAIKFLQRELREGDIIVTHYLPSPACVAPEWEGNETNCFFVTDLTQLIKDRKPALWLFGHTHSSIDVKVGSTRLVCNPFGYVNIDENPSFNSKFLVTL